MKSWICFRLSGVQWLAPVAGCALREGRIGDARVFGLDLGSNRSLLWASENAVKTALMASVANATAKLTFESRKAGESLPGVLPAMSGFDHIGILDSTKPDHVDGEAKLPKTRKTGWRKGTTALVDLVVTDAG